MSNIGQKIAEARTKAGMTQQELAERSGYKTKSAINKIELGLRDLPQKKIAAIAQALGVTPGYLMGWDEEPEEMGTIAASVIKDVNLLNLVRAYLKMSETDQRTLCALATSLDEKQKD